eukprot:3595931-Alexandrium_andersonii.AAC.1
MERWTVCHVPCARPIPCFTRADLKRCRGGLLHLPLGAFVTLWALGVSGLRQRGQTRSLELPTRT